MTFARTNGNVRFPPIADIGFRRENSPMDATLRPTAEQRVILERLQVPEHVSVALRQPSIALDAQDAETVREALMEEMARRGFDADYQPTTEGRLIEDLIDELFMP